MNDVGYIYKITNKLNNKIYIGKTKKTIPIRFKSHYIKWLAIERVEPFHTVKNNFLIKVQRLSKV